VVSEDLVVEVLLEAQQLVLLDSLEGHLVANIRVLPRKFFEKA